MGISNCIDKVTKFVGYLAAFLAIPLTLAVVYEVGMRFLFNKPTQWVYDISWMLFAAMFLLGGAYTLQEERHVRVDIIFRAFPPKVQKGIEFIFYCFLFLPMTLVLAWKGYDFTIWRGGQTKCFRRLFLSSLHGLQRSISLSVLHCSFYRE